MWAPLRGGVWAHKRRSNMAHDIAFVHVPPVRRTVYQRSRLQLLLFVQPQTRLAWRRQPTGRSHDAGSRPRQLARRQSRCVRGALLVRIAIWQGKPTKLDLAPDSLQDVRADAFEDGGALLVRRHAHELAVLPDAARRSIVACLAFRLLFVEKCTMRTHPLEQIDRVAKRGLVILIMRARCSNRPGGDRIWRGA